MTPRELFLAIRHGDVAKVRALLAHGADANWRNRSGDESAVTYAALMGNGDVYRLLVEHGATESSDDILLAAVDGGNVEIVKSVLEPRVIAQDFLNSLLREAAYVGSTPVIRYLLDQGADPAASSAGKTAEVLAREEGCTEAAEILREAAGTGSS